MVDAVHVSGVYGTVAQLRVCEVCGRGSNDLLAARDGENPATSAVQWVCRQCVVGRHTTIFWPVDEQWYSAAVTAYHPLSGKHLVRYPDGTQEWVALQSASQPEQVTHCMCMCLGLVLW